MEKSETSCLTGLKGLACLIIAFVWHYQHFAPAEGYPFYDVFNVSYRSGLYFVELFFILSGFVMTLGYASKVMEGRISFGQYMKRRIIKIYPLYLIALLLVTAAELMYKHANNVTFVYGNFDIKHFIMHLFCLQGGILSTDWSFNAPSWCITVCFVMYIIFFAVMRSTRSYTVSVIPWSVLMAAGYLMVWKEADYPVINTLIGRGFICFPFGVLMAYAYLHMPDKAKLPTGFVATVGLAAVYYYLRRTDPLLPLRTQMIYTFIFAPLMILAALYLKPLNKALATRPVQYLGELSLPVYLLHFFVQVMIDMANRHFEWEFNYSSRKVWLLYVICVLAVAAIYNEIVHKRILNRAR